MLLNTAGGLQSQCAYFHHTDFISYNYTCDLSAESLKSRGGGAGVNAHIKVAMQTCWQLPDVYCLKNLVPHNGGPNEQWGQELLSIIKFEQ